MSRSLAASDRRITERCDKAQREWFKKVETILKASNVDRKTNRKVLQDLMNQASMEYNKIFGRIGVHPLMHIKDGKARPRYLVDRDETWVMYKPPLWQMGSNPTTWNQKISELRRSQKSLAAAQAEYMSQDRTGTIQEWHGLTQGTHYITDADDDEQPVADFGFVQRLDCDTDGPVAVAKTWRAQRVLQALMQQHVFSKAYICLVHGRVENRVQTVKCRFAELGGEENTQVMLKYDAEHDPFYSISERGDTPGRSVRMAETFFKPMAYYRREADNSDYTLVYVNILTGITHQIRITMQSVGHPLVSDDRYLPKDQAAADVRWCPRNFLCEVRQDWFDVFGPHTDPKRRNYTRISVENPLPKLFQSILTSKLTLVEKLDPTADLFTGPQYWAIGDEQLIAQHPKTEEFRRKVMRWGQRRGIGLDCLDRLLLLPKGAIRGLLQDYKSPAEDLDRWVCPKCMMYNTKQNTERRGKDETKCIGGAGASRNCEGTRTISNDDQMPAKGWHNWLSDPTIHFLMQVNDRWLMERRKILEFERPSWEKPPAEVDGTKATKDILDIIEAALVLNTKQGGFGLSEEDLLNLPGLKDLVLPLGEPPEDSPVKRVRLPGRGYQGQWTFTLRGSERIKHTHDFNCAVKYIREPLKLETDEVPEKMLPNKEQRQLAKLQKQEKAVAEQKQKDEEVKKLKKLGEDLANGTIARKKQKRNWKKVEMASSPGTFYYFDIETGESQTEQPDDYDDSVPLWSRVESKTKPGKFYYLNSETGEKKVDRPVGVEVLNEDKEERRAKVAEVKIEEVVKAPVPKEPVWERKESKSQRCARPRHARHASMGLVMSGASGDEGSSPPALCRSELGMARGKFGAEASRCAAASSSLPARDHRLPNSTALRWLACAAAAANVLGRVDGQAVSPASTSVECRAGLDAMLNDENWNWMNTTFTRWCRVRAENEMSRCCGIADFEKGRAEGCAECLASCIHRPFEKFCNSNFGKACQVVRKPFFRRGTSEFEVKETFCVPEDCDNTADRTALMAWFSATYKARRYGWHKDYDEAILECDDGVLFALLITVTVILGIVLSLPVFWFLLKAPKERGKTLLTQDEMEDEQEDDENHEEVQDLRALGDAGATGY